MSVYIHVGLPKTASTSLQLGLFSCCPLWDFVGVTPGVKGNKNAWQIEAEESLLYVATAEESDFRSRESAIRDLFARKQDRVNQTLLISDEKLTTSHYFVSETCYTDRRLIAERLRRLFPDSGIIMFIRKQQSFLPSLFGQMLRHGCIPSQSYGEWLSKELEKWHSGRASGLMMGDHQAIYQTYLELFGQEQVKLILFEDYVRNNDQGMSQLTDFMGFSWEEVKAHVSDSAPSNARATKSELALRRLYRSQRGLGRLVPKRLRAKALSLMKFGPKVDHHYTDAEIESLREIFGAGNAALQAEASIELEAAGYLMPNGGGAQHNG